MLDKLLDAGRLADIAKHDAALTPTRCIRASGNHLAAQNDEPELGDLTEADLIEIDRAYEADKRSGALQRSEMDRAVREQQQAYFGRGWL